MYGLIGKNLIHSFSAKFFTEKFQKEGIDEIYLLMPIPAVKEVKTLIQEYPDLKGFNVTIPYKEDIIPFLSRISDRAKKIGAVNVVKIVKGKEGEKILEGYNTDYIGFKDSLFPLLSKNVTKALILGSGGASKAVARVLEDLGIEVTKVSRSPKEKNLAYNNLTEEIIRENLLIINCTPLGTFPATEEYPPIPYQFLTREHLCYDLVYNPEITEFMKRALQQGAKVKNGQEMLELQALASWKIWNE